MASSLIMSIALIASSSLTLVAAQPATSPSCLPFPRIEVRGGSRIRVDPDQVQITIEATATRRNASIASELVAGAVASIKKELTGTSGGFDSVVSLSYRGPDLQYKWVSSAIVGQSDVRVPVGYMYREVLMVTASIDVNDTDTDADAEEDKGDAASTAATASLTKFAKTAATTVETIIQNTAVTASEESESAASSTTYTNPNAAASADSKQGWDPVPSLDDGSPKDPLVSIQSVKYGLTPKSQASSALRARRLATTDAKKKASVLAESMSLNLGELLYVTDFDSTPITTSNDEVGRAKEVSADSMVMPAMASRMEISGGGFAARGPGGDPLKQTFTADVSAAFAASSG